MSGTPSPSPLNLGRLFQVNMRVLDIDRAVAFYRDILGLRLHARRGNLAFFAAGEVRLLLEVVEEPDGRFDHPGSILYFSVPDVHGAYETLRARGVEFLAAPELIRGDTRRELWLAFFSDGEENTHAIAAERPVA